jgi:hypothetical protein
MTGEDIGDQKDLAHAVMICKVHKSVRPLELLVVRSCKGLLNPITNQNHLCSH